MIGSLVLAVSVALVAYTILPALSGAWFRRRRKRLLALLSAGTAGYCAGVGPEGIRFAPYAPKARGGTDAPVVVVPDKALFLRCAKSGVTELPGRKLRLLAVNTPLVLAAAARPLRRSLVAVMENGTADRDARTMMGSLPADEAVPDPLRYAWAAAGIFVEFLFFITWLSAYSVPLPAVTAMVAIFGKALPWCPPGLFLTLFAHRLAAKPGRDKKKDRRRGAVGLLLVAAGVSLNLFAIFFVIRQTGWVPF